MISLSPWSFIKWSMCVILSPHYIHVVNLYTIHLNQVRLTLEYFYLPGRNPNTENYFCIVKWPMFTNINHAQNCSCMCTAKTCDNKFCFVYRLVFLWATFNNFFAWSFFLIKLHIYFIHAEFVFKVTCRLVNSTCTCTALNEYFGARSSIYMVELLCSKSRCCSLVLFSPTAGH